MSTKILDKFVTKFLNKSIDQKDSSQQVFHISYLKISIKDH